MFKYVFKEYNPEYDDNKLFFDGSWFSGFCNDDERVFILSDDSRGFYIHNIDGINSERYTDICDSINALFNNFEYVEEHTDEYTYKQAMIENGLKYNPTLCGKLKELYKGTYSGFGYGSFDTVADYLTITTGKTWKTMKIYGYCQCDVCTVLYCEEKHKEEYMKTCGNVFLGCYKAFCLIDLDENGQEIEGTELYGFYVGDNEIRHDEDYKTVLCNYEGLKPEETKVLLISGQTVRTEYTYTEC